MKVWKASWLITAVLMLLLAACGGDEAEPTPTPTPAAAAAVTEEAEPTETPLPEPTAVPANPDPTAEPTTAAEPVPEPEPEQPDNLVPIVNDEGGPVSVTGVVTYTNPFFTLGVAAPVIILEDQAGFVDRDKDYIFPVASQTLGQITTDFYTSPFSYSVALPLQPQGAFRDVDFDEQAEQGVQVFAVAYWNNIWGDPFLEERDLGSGGWSTAYASTVTSTDPDNEREIVGGKLLVYAPDDQQEFPTGFGDDGLLFTEDDPVGLLPAGYTLVILDTDPFTFDRSRNPVVDLYEPESAALVDYSDLSYTEAFDALVDQLANEYAFTDYKEIDWEALRARFRPEIEQADEAGDAQQYLRALRDFAWSIPDGHVAGPFLGEEFRANVLGGIGMAIQKLDDGRFLTQFMLDGSPADEAGIALGAEITAINDTPIDEWVNNTIPWFGPHSTAHNLLLDQLQFSTRFPVGADVSVSYMNPGETAVQTAALRAGSELESYFFWFEEDDRDGFELPVEYELLDEGVGYVQILSFSDNDLLTIQLWERMIRNMIDEEVPAIIIDMRTNGGGRGFLADQMAAYFFQEPLVLGSASYFDEERGEFYDDPDTVQDFILPPEELRYDGDVVVLVGPDCASACEFFSFDMTLADRATIIGQYPTAGLGGSIDRVAMPEGEEFTFTQGRAVGPDGNIHIEGIGVVPDIRVPINEETLLADDAVLDAALAYLVGVEVDGGEIAVGDTVNDTLLPGERVLYTLPLTAGDFFSMVLESTDGATPLVLRVYDDNGNLLGETEPDTIAGFTEIELDEDVTFVLEVATAESGQTADYALIIADESE